MSEDKKIKNSVHSIAALLAGKIAVGSIVTVQGWVKTRRDSKAGCSFIALSDGSCFASLQIVAQATLPNYQAEILHITAGCSVEVTGTLVASPAKGQAVELAADTVRIVGAVDDPDTYPITPKFHTLEYLREQAHLRPRTNVGGAIARVRNCLAFAIHKFFNERGFIWVSTPIITASDCEGAGQQFRVTTLDAANPPLLPDGKRVNFAEDFFGREAFLTVSGQLNAESYCESLSKVYTFGPTFRAENSNTSRHLAEFWMVEPEIAFADLQANAQLAADFLQYLAQQLLELRADDLAFFAERIDKTCIERLTALAESKFTHMEYRDAVKELAKANAHEQFKFPVHFGADLQSEHERYLTEKLVGGPVVLMNYPREIKSFYMRQNDDGETVAAMDVLVPGIGEIIGGSQREERYEVLQKRMVELGMNLDTYRWYLDLRKYGSVPHAGFGLGFERFITYATGIGNIRDAIAFHRARGQADF